MNDKNGTYNGIEYLPSFCVANSTKNSGVKFATTKTPLDAGANIWHTATLTYTNDTGSSIDISQAELRYCGDNASGKEKYQCWVAKNHSGYDPQTGTFDLGERTLYFDDVNVSVHAPVITDTTLTKATGGIKVSAADSISNARLIFVKYDEYGRMLALNTETTVTLNAQQSKIYSIPSGFENAQIMLLKDLKTFVPLADAIR